MVIKNAALNNCKIASKAFTALLVAEVNNAEMVVEISRINISAITIDF